MFFLNLNIYTAEKNVYRTFAVTYFKFGKKYVYCQCLIIKQIYLNLMC